MPRPKKKAEVKVEPTTFKEKPKKERTFRTDPNIPSGVYKITNIINSRVYVGTSDDINGRWKTHFRQLESNTHINTEFQNEWNEYGQKNFKHEILEIIYDPFLFPEKEKYYIDQYKDNGINAYNKSDPTNEYLKGRQEKIVVYKGGNQGINSKEFKLKKEYIIDWIIENFKDILDKLCLKVEEDKYFDKGKFDRWLLNNIKDEDIKRDIRLEGLINKIYNKMGLYIVQNKMYSYQFYKLGINIKREVEYVLVNDKMNRYLHNEKFNYRKRKEQRD